ncbi:MAG: Fic family protein [Nanoarchaeota archaeon]
MVSIVTKKIKGNEYLYLVESVRKDNRIIQKTVKFIGKKRPITKEEFACMKMSHKKEDWILASFTDELSYQDHHEMKSLSAQQKKYLASLDPVSREQEKERSLALFISSSNAIEGSTVTFQETFDFLFNDIAPTGKTKKEVHMATNLLAAYNYMEEHHKKLPTNEDICNLHTLTNRDIESEKTLGKYKRIQNYIGEAHTTSFLFTEERMQMLLSWIKAAFQKMDEFEVAFHSHAQFELIHPFIDGNGRVGRILLNWLLLYTGLMPLAINIRRRSEYISAIRNAQRGNLRAFCMFCKQEYMKQYEFMK